MASLAEILQPVVGVKRRVVQCGAPRLGVDKIKCAIASPPTYQHRGRILNQNQLGDLIVRSQTVDIG